jgi:hypothetical protein
LSKRFESGQHSWVQRRIEQRLPARETSQIHGGTAVARVAVRAPGDRRAQLAHSLRWARPFAKDWSITLAIFVVYFLIRGAAPANPDFAMEVTRFLIDFEKATLTFWEPRIQEISIQWHVVKEIANFVYAYLHFPVLIAVGAWLWFRNRRDFTFLRNVIFISMVFGIAFYYLLPAAPPRLIAEHGYDLGFVDTVFKTETIVSYAQPDWILNEYAAIPSFHFGWIAVASAGIWVYCRNPWIRALAVALSLVMSWAIIASANHFWIDMAMGGLIILVSWWIARRLERATDRRRERRAIEQLRGLESPPAG